MSTAVRKVQAEHLTQDACYTARAAGRFITFPPALVEPLALGFCDFSWAQCQLSQLSNHKASSLESSNDEIFLSKKPGCQYRLYRVRASNAPQACNSLDLRDLLLRSLQLLPALLEALLSRRAGRF